MTQLEKTENAIKHCDEISPTHGQQCRSIERHARDLARKLDAVIDYCDTYLTDSRHIRDLAGLPPKETGPNQ